MTSVAQRYDRLSTAFASTIAAVPADRWEDPSPCEGWNARDVLQHVIDGHDRFFQLVGRSLAPVPTVEDDPVEAFEITRRQMLGDLEDPDRAADTFQGLSGISTFESGVDRFVNLDLVIHRWDLATATGQQIALDAEDLKRVEQQVPQLGEAARAPGVFGPPLEPPAGADLQTRVLAFVGRRA